MIGNRYTLATAPMIFLAVLIGRSAGDFHIDWYTVDGGGETFSTGGAFKLGGSVGQPDAGYMTGGAFSAIGGFWVFGTPPDTVPPEIVHGAAGVSFEDHAFSGYVDPRCDVGNPPFCNVANQIDSAVIVFNVEPFGDDQGGPLTTGNFVVAETGGGAAPNVINVTKIGNAVTVQLDRVITQSEWTTIEANVFNSAGVAIEDLGNQGPGIDETDRIDVGTLSGDIDQTGGVLPLDNTRFRQMFAGAFANPKGIDEDYIDVTRDGSILPLDNTAWRIGFNGWLFASLPTQP